jgi:hypothetical protein
MLLGIGGHLFFILLGIGGKSLFACWELVGIRVFPILLRIRGKPLFSYCWGLGRNFLPFSLCCRAKKKNLPKSKIMRVTAIRLQNYVPEDIVGAFLMLLEVESGSGKSLFACWELVEGRFSHIVGGRVEFLLGGSTRFSY